MSPSKKFVSAIASTITRYVALKRALGRKTDTLRYILLRLDRFLAAERAEDLDAETFAAWAASIDHLAASNRRQQMRIVYHLCLFRRRSEPRCFLPDPSQFPPLRPRPRPYIFSEGEIGRLLRATDDLLPNAPSPLHRQVGRLAIVLLYTAGLRRGELVRLKLGDYDASGHVIHVQDSKFHKSRLVPLSYDAVVETDRYLDERRRLGFPCGAETALLLNNHGGLTGYSGPALAGLVRKLIRLAAIRTPSGRPPRVHDLRFTFAVHAMLRWYRAGLDVQTRLPALSTYMGHVSIVSTQYYLMFLDVVAEAAGDRFQEHCARFLPNPKPSFAGEES
jgi:integrase/recombinase XerD